MKRLVMCAAAVILMVADTPSRLLGAAAGLSNRQWSEDVAYFAREMPKRHKNLYHAISRTQFEQSVADLSAALPSLSDPQIMVRLAQIAASVGDGHTRVNLMSTFKRYPLVAFWFGNDLRITAATKEYERALGSRLVKIGDSSIDQVQKRVGTCFPSAENENAWYVMGTSPEYIMRPEILVALGIVRNLESAPFIFEDDQGGQFTLEVSPVIPDKSFGAGLLRASASDPLSRQRREERFWFTYLPDSRTVYLNFKGYDDLGSQAREFFKFVDQHAPDRLVIDMRQNGGGDFLKGRKHLIEPIKKRASLNQKGKLFVMVGRHTFSAAMVNAIDFRKETQALLVGEPIGERPNSYSENDEMTLPNSRLVVSYSTEYYQFLDEDVPAVLPDQRIDPDWPAYKEGRDPVMEWILAYDSGHTSAAR